MIDDPLERLKAAKTPEEKDWLLTEWSLEHLPDPLRAAVWAAAIPHWFDLELLAALLDQPPPEVEGLMSELTALSYVELYRDRGHDVHESTRKTLLDRLWETDRRRFRELSRRAAEHCAKDFDKPGNLVEWVYHLLIAEPDKGADALCSVGWKLQNPPFYAYDLVGEMAAFAHEHASSGRLEERGVGWTLFWQAHLDEIYDRRPAAREKLLSIAELEVVDPQLTADTYSRLGEVDWLLSDHESARARHESALEVYRELGDRLGEANCIQSLGDVDLSLSDHESARARYESALEAYRELGDRLGEANCIKALGDVDLSLSDQESARARYESALEVYRELGDRLGEANCIWSLGDVDLRLSDHESARARYKSALEVYRELGARLGEANCIKALGEVDLRLSHYESARARYESALPVYREIGDRLGEANCIQSLGDVDMSLSRHEAARARYESAAGLFRELGNPVWEADVSAKLGGVARALGDVESARSHYQRATAIYRRRQADDDLSAQLSILASLTPEGSAEQAGLFEEASEALEREAAKQEKPIEELYNYACLSALRGDAEKALGSLEACLEAGNVAVSWVEQDPDWQGLRSDPRLIALLDRFRTAETAEQEPEQGEPE